MNCLKWNFVKGDSSQAGRSEVVKLDHVQKFDVTIVVIDRVVVAGCIVLSDLPSAPLLVGRPVNTDDLALDLCFQFYFIVCDLIKCRCVLFTLISCSALLPHYTKDILICVTIQERSTQHAAHRFASCGDNCG